MAGAHHNANPSHEKLAAALNIDGPDLIATTGGYLGDAPRLPGSRRADRPRERARSAGVQYALREPPHADRAAQLHGERLGDPVPQRTGRRARRPAHPDRHRQRPLERDAPTSATAFSSSRFPSLSLRQSFTPTDQEHLNTTDTDLGSSAPALLGDERIVLAGKDGIMRVLDLSRLDGHPPSSPQASSPSARRGNPASSDTRRRPSCSRRPPCGGRDGSTTMFVADENGTAAYVLRNGFLYRGVDKPNAGDQPGDGRGAALRVRPLSWRNQRLPPGLPAADRHASRHAGALEQPDRRRRARGRARGQRQRPQAHGHAGAVLGS